MTQASGIDQLAKIRAGRPQEDEPKSVGESFPKMTPPKQRCSDDYDARGRAAQAANEAVGRAAAWSASGVSKRHTARVVPVSGEAWGDKLQQLLAMLHSGMLVALLGKRGTGKTQLAVELIRHMIFHGPAPYGSAYTTAMDVFMAVRETYGNHDTTERKALIKFTQPSLVVIDEAHERGASEWEDRMLNHLIDRRYLDVKDTVLISNESAATFRESIGSSIYSRLTEAGGIIVCDWPTFRGAK